MKYHYEPGAVRWFKFDGDGDVRSYRSPAGWETYAELTDINPVTGRQLQRAQWWIRETYTGE